MKAKGTNTLFDLWDARQTRHKGYIFGKTREQVMNALKNITLNCSMSKRSTFDFLINEAFILIQ